MEKQLAKGTLGTEGKYRVEFRDGKLTAEFIYDNSIFDANLVLSLDSDMVLDALMKAIPGDLDNKIFAVAKTFLKGSPNVVSKEPA